MLNVSIETDMVVNACVHCGTFCSVQIESDQMQGAMEQIIQCETCHKSFYIKTTFRVMVTRQIFDLPAEANVK